MVVVVVVVVVAAAAVVVAVGNPATLAVEAHEAFRWGNMTPPPPAAAAAKHFIFLSLIHI